MSERYENTFPPEVWLATDGNPLDMINAWNVAWRREGAEDERKRIIAMAEAKVCFGHQETGNCEHSVCFGMRDLISKIEAAE